MHIRNSSPLWFCWASRIRFAGISRNKRQRSVLIKQQYITANQIFIWKRTGIFSAFGRGTFTSLKNIKGKIYECIFYIYHSLLLNIPEFPLFSENIPFATFSAGRWYPCVVEWFYLHTTVRQEGYRFSISNPLRKKSRNIQMERVQCENWVTKSILNNIWRSGIWISTSVPNTSESFSYYSSSSCWHPSYNFIYIFDKHVCCLIFVFPLPMAMRWKIVF